MRIGTPRKLCIGGWFGGKPYDCGCLVMSGIRTGRGSVMSRPEHAAPVRQVADRGVQLRIDAVGDEVGQLPVRPDDAERAVAGADQLAGRRDDPLQRAAQVEVGADADHRVEQGPQPFAAGHHLADAVEHRRRVRIGSVPVTGHGPMLAVVDVEDLRPWGDPGGGGMNE